MARFGLLGEHLGHSYSPLIHTKLGSSPYTLFEVAPVDVEDFVKNGDWDGINVTIPYKKRAAELADEKSERVRALGAANTLIRRADGTIFAENTDVMGFYKLLERFCAEKLDTTPRELLSGKSALVLGTGGASQAVAYALEHEAGAKVSCLTHAQIDEYNEMGSDLLPHFFDEGREAVLLVNTTPVGMAPNCPECPVRHWVLDKTCMPVLRGVIDVIYNPCVTGLCFQAKAKGIPSVSGLPMLVWQAVYASELFQGKELDHSRIDNIIKGVSKAMTNIVIIGMPGSGKSSTGRALAHMTSRAFVDLDDAFTLHVGRTPAEVIEQDGENTFRELEHEVAKEYGAKSGLVIACGGGIVERGFNHGVLAQNGTIVFLDRPLEELSSEGRPLSKRHGVEALWIRRRQWYFTWADAIVKSTGSARGDAQAIIEELSL